MKITALSHDAALARQKFEAFLHEKSYKRFSSIDYGCSGAEANEIAFDLCRQKRARWNSNNRF